MQTPSTLICSILFITSAWIWRGNTESVRCIHYSLCLASLLGHLGRCFTGTLLKLKLVFAFTVFVAKSFPAKGNPNICMAYTGIFQMHSLLSEVRASAQAFDNVMWRHLVIFLCQGVGWQEVLHGQASWWWQPLGSGQILLVLSHVPSKPFVSALST